MTPLGELTVRWTGSDEGDIEIDDEFDKPPGEDDGTPAAEAADEREAATEAAAQTDAETAADAAAAADGDPDPVAVSEEDTP